MFMPVAMYVYVAHS